MNVSILEETGKYVFIKNIPFRDEMNPRFCIINNCEPRGTTLEVLNVINQDTETVSHYCRCKKCGESFLVEQTIGQWKRD